MKEKKSIWLLMCLLLLVTFACDYKFITPDQGEPVDPDDPISFSEQVEPIWAQQGCTSCHPDAGGLNLTAGNAYNSLMSHPRAINEANAGESTILTFKTEKPGPHANVDYAGNQSEIIKVWIEQGAEDN